MRQAILLAGGKGTRLQPFAASFPKPLVPLGDMPVLEVLIRRLRANGFDKITLAVGHLAPLIQAYFQDGSRFDVEIQYSLEHEPLGTAGPLTLVADLDEHFLVMNGDLLTDMNFRELMDVHVASSAAVTVARYRCEVQIHLGVIEVDEADRLVSYDEKPTLRYDVSMGAYAFRRATIEEHLLPGVRTEMPDLIRRVKGKGLHVGTKLHDGFWLDIGRPADYARAQELYEAQPELFRGSP